jgi:hypothetical protein
MADFKCAVGARVLDYPLARRSSKLSAIVSQAAANSKRSCFMAASLAISARSRYFAASSR